MVDRGSDTQVSYLVQIKIEAGRKIEVSSSDFMYFS